MDYLGQLPYTLTESSYLTLTIHIVLSITRMQNGEYVSLNKDIYETVKDTFEHEVATEIAKRLEEIYNVEFNQAEITFITIHLRGAKRKGTKDSNSEEDNSSKKIRQFVNTVTRISGQHFKDKENLIEGLTLHINPAINRLKSNIETYNPLTEMIKFKYPRLFETIHKALHMVWSDLIFPESEIAFIVLHFGGSIKNQGNRFLNILVVCSSGIGTSRLLANRLEQVFSEIERITQASVSDLNVLDLNNYDGIISTVNLDIEAPFLIVNPLLPEHEVSYVASFLSTNSNQTLLAENDNSNTFTNPEETIQDMRVGLEVLDSVKIEYKLVDNWKQYLETYLLNENIIEDRQSFADLLQSKFEQNPNWVLHPYPIAIPHLKDNMFKKPSILITILEEPIQLQRNQNDLNSVHYLISMFIPDNQKMAQFVSALSEALSEHLNDIEEFMQNPYEFKTILRNKLLNQIKNQLQ